MHMLRALLLRRAAAALRRPRPARRRRARRSPRSSADDRTCGGRVAPETLHVTLAFLGEQPTADAAIAPGRRRRRRRARPAPRARRRSCSPPRRARVLTVELDDATGARATCRRRISAELAARRRLHAREAPVPPARHGRPAAPPHPPAARRATRDLEPLELPRPRPSRSTPRSCTRRAPATRPLATAALGRSLSATLSLHGHLHGPEGRSSPRCSPSPRCWPSRTPRTPR